MSTDSTEPAGQPEQTLALVSTAKGPLAFLTDTAAFNHLWRIASAYAASSIVPQHVRGHREDCFILCQMAIRMDVDPFMLMQNCYVVHGRPGFLAQFAIARLNASGRIRGTLQFEFSGEGEEYGCTAWAVDADTGKRVNGPTITRRMVKAEGWDKDTPTKTGGVQKSKWNTMPDLMFRYRAAAFFVRTAYPDVMLGLQTVEEIRDSVLDVEAYEAGAEKPANIKDRIALQAANGEPKLPQPEPKAEPTPEPKRRGRPPKAEPTPESPAVQTSFTDPSDADILDDWQEAISAADTAEQLDRYSEKANDAFRACEITGPVFGQVRAAIAAKKAQLQ